MKIIKITKGFETIVDDEDFENLNQYKWHYDNGYAVREQWNGDRKTRYSIRMHRYILNLKKYDKKEVDHINMNRLDNRKENLRIVNKTRNSQNRTKQSNNTSGYKGVNWKKDMKKWMARITYNKKEYFLGYFDNKEDAARAYDKAAIKYFGEYSRLNFPNKEK